MYKILICILMSFLFIGCGGDEFHAEVDTNELTDNNGGAGPGTGGTDDGTGSGGGNGLVEGSGGEPGSGGNPSTGGTGGTNGTGGETGVPTCNSRNQEFDVVSCGNFLYEGYELDCGNPCGYSSSCDAESNTCKGGCEYDADESFNSCGYLNQATPFLIKCSEAVEKPPGKNCVDQAGIGSLTSLEWCCDSITGI